ncbi:MAG: Eco57I restriction-modification methylase domain-containing protein [Promethearchaeota archaeon]
MRAIKFVVKNLKCFTRRNIKMDIGLKSEIARKFILFFHDELNSKTNNMTQTKKESWWKNFEYLHENILKSNMARQDLEGVMIKHFKEGMDHPSFLFSIYTYYSLVVKLISLEACVKRLSYNDSLLSRMHSSRTIDGAFDIIKSIPENMQFNFYQLFHDDFFTWYLDGGDDFKNKFSELMSDLLSILIEFDYFNLHEFQDFFKIIHEECIPVEIRHDLGEYQTPKWLVSLTIKETGYPGNKNDKVLDPGCGSGAFLIELIRIFRARNHDLEREKQLKLILNNIVGIDINPVACICAKMNYLLAVIDLVTHDTQDLNIPVYLADSMYPTGLVFKLESKDFAPTGNPPKNHVFQLSTNNFDYIIGNPPWIKWEFLSKAYKDKITPILEAYNLFDFRGQKAMHGFAHDDISIPFLITTCDNYLKDGGKLGFILKSSLFTNEAGRTLRALKIENRITRTTTPLSVKKIIDLQSIKPFKPYKAETCIGIFIKGEKNAYPVKWEVWSPADRKIRISDHDSLASAMPKIKTKIKYALPDPIEKNEKAPWIFVNDQTDTLNVTAAHHNPYKPRHGVVNDLVSVFFV